MATPPPRPPIPTGEQFHVPGARVYAEPLGPAIHKRAEAMARVLYTAVHENRAFDAGDDRRGHGRDHATWVFSEEPGLQEDLFHGGLELMIDARLEPGAAIGLHRHPTTEEIYDLLEGQLTMTTVLNDGREVRAVLRPGDASAVVLGGPLRARRRRGMPVPRGRLPAAASRAFGQSNRLRSTASPSARWPAALRWRWSPSS